LHEDPSAKSRREGGGRGQREGGRGGREGGRGVRESERGGRDGGRGGRGGRGHPGGERGSGRRIGGSGRNGRGGKGVVEEGGRGEGVDKKEIESEEENENAVPKTLTGIFFFPTFPLSITHMYLRVCVHT